MCIRDRVYYLDNVNGRDSNSGLTEALAWNTIAKVNTISFSPGDQILFKRGETWHETLIPLTSGIDGAPIVFGSYGTGDLPIIDGEDTRHCVDGSGKSYLTFQELDCRNGVGYGFRLNGVDHITVQDCVASGMYWYGVSVIDGTSILVQHCTFSDGYRGVSFSTVHYSRVHHNVVTNMRGGGIDVVDGSDDNEVDENDSSFCAFAGCYLNGERNLVHNNHFHHNWSVNFPTSDEPYGIGVYNSSYCEIYDNEINNNQCHGIEFWSGAGNTSSNNKVYRNKIYNNEQNGITITSPTAENAFPADNEIYYNLFYNNGWRGFGISTGHTGTGNKFYNTVSYTHLTLPTIYSV